MMQRRGSRQRPRPPGPRREGLRSPANKHSSDWLTPKMDHNRVPSTTLWSATWDFGSSTFCPKSERADQSVRRRGLKLRGMVEPARYYNITKARPDRPQGGAAAIKSTKWPVTPRPSVADPSVLHHRNPWLGPNKMHASDWGVALARFSGIWDYVKNLLLHTSPRFFARSDPNRCRKILWSLTANRDREIVGISIHVGDGTPKRWGWARRALLKWL